MAWEAKQKKTELSQHYADRIRGPAGRSTACGEDHTGCDLVPEARLSGSSVITPGATRTWSGATRNQHSADRNESKPRPN